MKDPRRDARGRGTSSLPSNRFARFHLEISDEPDSFFADDDGPSKVRTEVIPDPSRTVINRNDSPDLGFEFSVNPYRGCEHGCAYCYARPTHEYLGYSAGLDFETKILVKLEAPKLLREALLRKSWTPSTIVMSGVTDCYQPLERTHQLTRGCLKVLAEFKNPVCIITKNALVARDIDILSEMARWEGALVAVSVTTLDDALGAKLEPRTSRPAARLRAIRELSQAGVPVAVNVAPCIPGLTDHEMPRILEAAREAGATRAGYAALRLPGAVSGIFEDWMREHRPERAEKVLGLIRGMRGGKLNDARFGSRMRGEGAVAQNIAAMFATYARRAGLNQKSLSLAKDQFRRPAQAGEQLGFF